MNVKYTRAGVGRSGRVETPSVSIVDEDISVRESLASLVRSAGWQPVTAASAEEYLACPPRTGPACLLTELRLPAASGLDLQRCVSERAELPVIFMSSGAHVQAIVQAMKAGAFEFLAKPVLRQVLLKTIHEAIDHSRAVLLQFEQTRALQRRYESLTRRERQVLCLVVSGRLNKQVGCELGISVITVKAHRGRMMRKMQARSVLELVSMAASLRSMTSERDERAFRDAATRRTLPFVEIRFQSFPSNQSRCAARQCAPTDGCLEPRNRQPYSKPGDQRDDETQDNHCDGSLAGNRCRGG